MDAPPLPFSVRHLVHAEQQPWLDGLLLHVAQADGQPDDLSWKDLQDWYEQDAAPFAQFHGPAVSRIDAMSQHVRQYLAVRMIQRAACREAPVDRALLVAGVYEAIDFAALGRIAVQGGSLRRYMETFRRYYCEHLQSLLATTTDAPLLLAALGARRRKQPLVNALAYQRLLTLDDPATHRALLTLLATQPSLVQQQVCQVLGAHAVGEALLPLVTLVDGGLVDPVAAEAASVAIGQIMEAHPEEGLDALIRRCVDTTDTPSPPRAIEQCRWVIDQVLSPARLGRVLDPQRIRVMAAVAARLDASVLGPMAVHHGKIRRLGIELLGRLGLPSALHYLHAYCALPALEPFYGDLVEAITNTYRQFAARGLSAEDVAVWQEESERVLVDIARIAYGTTIVRRDLMRELLVLDRPVPLTGQLMGPTRLAPATRAALVHALGAIGSRQAVAALVEIVRKESGDSLRQAAVAALEQIGQRDPSLEGMIAPYRTPPTPSPTPRSLQLQRGRAAPGPLDPPPPTPPNISPVPPDDEPAMTMTPYTIAHGGYEFATPYHMKTMGPDIATVRAIFTHVHRELVRLKVPPHYFDCTLVYQQPQAKGPVPPADGTSPLWVEAPGPDYIDYAGIAQTLQASLVALIDQERSRGRFARYVAIAEEAESAEIRVILTPRSTREIASTPLARCPLPPTPGVMNDLLQRWRVTFGHHFSRCDIKGEGAQYTIIAAPADGASLDRWITAWQSLADDLRRMPCHPPLVGRLRVRLTVPVWPAGEHYEGRLRAALQQAFARTRVELMLAPFQRDPARWMPKATTPYRIRNGLVLLPTTTQLGPAIPMPTTMQGLFVDLYTLAVAGHISLAEYDLLLLFSAPTTLHDEDPPHDLNVAVLDGVHRGLRQFRTEESATFTQVGSPHSIQSVIFLGPGDGWRCFPALVPKHLHRGKDAMIPDAQLQLWWRELQAYWPPE